MIQVRPDIRAVDFLNGRYRKNHNDEVKFYFYVVGVTKETTLSLYLADSEDIYTDEITWNDRPDKEGLIEKVNIDNGNGWYKVDITDIIDDEELENIVILLNLTHYTDDILVSVDSRDGNNEPYIKWIYHPPDMTLIYITII